MDYYRAENFSDRFDGLSSGTIGAVGELLVAQDLLAKGFDVFRSLSPNCKCDLIAQLDGVLVKIEVTSGQVNLRTGTISHHSKGGRDFDILAVTLPENEIVYEVDGDAGEKIAEILVRELENETD